MQIELKVVLTASPELLAALTALAGSRTNTPEAVAPVKKKLAAVPQAATVDAQPSPSIASVEKVQENGTTHTLESLRAIAVPKSKAGKKDEIKAWLSTAGYASLQDLQEKDFNEFYGFIVGL